MCVGADRQGPGLGATAREGGEACSRHNRPGEARVRSPRRNRDAARLLAPFHRHEQLRPAYRPPRTQLRPRRRRRRR